MIGSSGRNKHVGLGQPLRGLLPPTYIFVGACTLRTRLPSRRPVQTTTLQASNGQLFDASLGFDTQGKVREVFLQAHKTTSELANILADFAVILSIALQYNISISELSKSISRIPTEIDGPPVAPASVLGEVLDLIQKVSGDSNAENTNSSGY